jgi:phage shock protein C
MNTQLMRSRNDRMIAGVCGGLASYLNIDPVLVRLVFALGIFFGGLTPLVYLVMLIVMPEERVATTSVQTFTAQNSQYNAASPVQQSYQGPTNEWRFDPYTGERLQKDQSGS